MPSLIAPQTIQAYRQTEYRVAAEASFVLRIDHASAALAQLYRKYRTNGCVYLTACNPHSQITNAQQNVEQQARLADELRQHGLIYFPGIGQHPDGDWPGEASFLVLGVTREQAWRLGEQYRQNAIVWCGADAVPQLLLLR